jgi:hypothetical protein
MTEALHQPTSIPQAAMGPPGATSPNLEGFSEGAVEELHSADRKAAGMVAGLMVSIFTIGMVIYLYVFSCAMAGPP